MKYLITAIIIAGIGILTLYLTNDTVTTPIDKIAPGSNTVTQMVSDAPETTTVAEGLDTPWAMVILPDDSKLITERQGTIRRVNSNGDLEPNLLATIEDAVEIGEGGLLGMTLHPDFETNNYIYLYYTYQGNGSRTLNRVVRSTYSQAGLTNEETVVDAIPGAPNHNGGEIAFGPDGYLYITTGDAQEPSQAQDTNSLAGKILRVTSDGEPAPENPFENRVYSYGHRNPQGIDWDDNGNLWATEHGRSGGFSGFDEINLIVSGGNYGWPTIQGDETQEGMIAPIIHSGATTTWAPGSIQVIDGFIYFSGLRGSALYRGEIRNNTIDEVSAYYKDEYGRLREVFAGENGLLYITTSNLDGRGNPAPADDRIIQINTSKLK